MQEQEKNKGGRPKGSRNKATKELKDLVLKIVSKNMKQIQEDLDKLTPNERLNQLNKLIQYVIPKQNSSKVDVKSTSNEFRTWKIEAPSQNDNLLNEASDNTIQIHPINDIEITLIEKNDVPSNNTKEDEMEF